MTRTLLSVLAATAVATIGAVLLGEFAFSGVSVIFSAVLLGLFVAETTVGLAKKPSQPLAVVAALLTALSLMAAAWTFTAHRLGSVVFSGWLAVALGAATAWIRARPRNTRNDIQASETPIV